MKSNLDYVMALSLAYASYTMATCPCEKPCGCKYTKFVIAAGVPLAYVILGNYYLVQVSHGKVQDDSPVSLFTYHTSLQMG